MLFALCSLRCASSIPPSAFTLPNSVSLSPGMNHIWAQVEGPAWLPIPESVDHNVLLSRSVLKLTRGDLPRVIEMDSVIEVTATVENLGPWPLNASYLPGPDHSSIGLSPRYPEYSLDLFGSWLGLGPVRINSTSIDDLDIGMRSNLNWSIDLVSQPGRLDFLLRLKGSQAGNPP